MTFVHSAPWPARGFYADGFAPVAERFAEQLRTGEQLGASFSATHEGTTVVDLWGGLADASGGRARPWSADTPCVVFSVTKGLTAMALHLLVERGALAWDAPVAEYWPGFAQGGKAKLSVRTLFNHRGGLPTLDEKLRVEDFMDPSQRERITALLERQRPLWEPGTDQGYHAATYGMYARELIERVAGESAGTLLRRELFEPLGAEVWIGAPASVQSRLARLVPPHIVERLARMGLEALRGDSVEARMLRSNLRGDRLSLRAFVNPAVGLRGPGRYGESDVTRSELLWGSGVATARGLARAYLPFALGGVVEGRRYFSEASLEPLQRRQGWSERDRVMHKPLGWSQGFLKEERTVVSAGERSFGHFGLGGALAWCDPEKRVTLGYVPNKLDWRVRSPRSMALCRALYECAPVREGRSV